MKKIKSNGTQLFNVPNTVGGRMFLHQMKKYRQKGNHLATRGRASNRKKTGSGKFKQAFVPLKNAEWWAVYLTKSPELEDLRAIVTDQGKELAALNREASKLKNELECTTIILKNKTENLNIYEQKEKVLREMISNLEHQKIVITTNRNELKNVLKEAISKLEIHESNTAKTRQWLDLPWYKRIFTKFPKMEVYNAR